MISKQGNWVPYELKPRDVERRFLTCEWWLARRKEKVFCIEWSLDEKWIHYDNPKRKKSYGYPGHASTSTTKSNIHGKKLMLCILWDKLGLIYWELSKPNEMIAGDVYRRQLMRLKEAMQKERPIFHKIILQHDNATCCFGGQNILGSAELWSLTPSAVFDRHCPFRLPLVSGDDSWRGWAALHFLWGMQKMGEFLDRLRRRRVLRTWMSKGCSKQQAILWIKNIVLIFHN